MRAEERQRRRFSEILAHGARRPAPARNDEPARRFLRRAAERRAALCGASADQRAAAARGAAARGREPAGRASLRPLRDRSSRHRHRPPDGRGIRQGRRRAAAALLPARRHVDTDGRARRRHAAPAARRRSSSAACWPSAPTPSSLAIRTPRNELRRIFTLKLATVREDGEPTRRRAVRSEFSDEEWRLVSELADHPNRLLVTATPEGGETYAEVAHEAIFRRWDKLREWIAAERDFLAWRSGLEAARRAWQATPDSSKNDALLMGAALTQAQSWLASAGEDLPVADRDFIDRSVERESKARASDAARAGPHLRAVGRHHRRTRWRGSIRPTSRSSGIGTRRCGPTGSRMWIPTCSSPRPSGRSSRWRAFVNAPRTVPR